MNKVFFDFSYQDRFLASKLNLKWDRENKKWYCTDDGGFGMYQNIIFQIYMLLPIRLRLINYDLSVYKEDILSEIKSLNHQDLKELEGLYINNIIVKSNIIDKVKNYGKNRNKFDFVEKKIKDLKFNKHNKYLNILIANNDIVKISNAIPDELRDSIEKWIDLHDVDLYDLLFNGNLFTKLEYEKLINN